jgi:hypothetical protein
MDGLTIRALALVVAVSVFSIGSFALATESSASTTTGSQLRFSVTRVPTSVTNADLSIPGGAHDNAFSPAQRDLTNCLWFDGIPGRPVLRRSSPYYPGTKCSPLISGKTFGLLESPRNGHFQNEVLRVARAAVDRRGVSVGPVLVTFADGAGGRPSAAEADGWIWVYVPQGRRADVLRFSAVTGVLAQRISIAPMEEPIISANDEGLFLGWSNQGGLHGAVYLLAVGSSQPELLQSTSRFVFLMRARSHYVTVIEARRAAGPFVAYRFTPLAK